MSRQQVGKASVCRRVERVTVLYAEWTGDFCGYIVQHADATCTIRMAVLEPVTDKMQCRQVVLHVIGRYQRVRNRDRSTTTAVWRANQAGR